MYDKKRKQAQISEYQRKDYEKKYNDIKGLLAKMADPRKDKKGDDDEN
jgi:hypothetical protein